MIKKSNCKDHPVENEYHGFFVPTQGSKMRRKIKELDDKLSTRTQKHEETEREVSLFWWISFHYNSADVSLDWFPNCLVRLRQDDK